jgi:O-antigen/teichoic acid export membrane protein
LAFRLRPKSQFMRRLMMLSGSLAAGQAIMVAVSPLLTRLYDPEDFGLFAVFSALTGVIGVMMSLRYELGIPIARDDAEAADMAGLSFLIALGVSLLMVPLVWFGGERLAAATDLPGLAWLLWLLPLTVFAAGLGQLLSYWSVHRGTFRVNALSRFLQSATQAVLQVGFGALNTGAPGLVLGYAIAYFTRIANFALIMPRADWALLRGVRFGAMRRLAVANWHYAAYSAPSTLLLSATQLLPAVLLAMLYGPAVAGWFGLGQRLMGMPVRLLAQAASSVFLGEVVRLAPDAVYRLFKRASLRFLGLGLLGMGPLLVLGPELFAVAFGERWRPAGEMAQLLAPVHLVRFVVVPVSQTLNLFRRQHLHLFSSGLATATLALSFGAGWWLDLPPLATVALYSVGSTLAGLLYFANVWRVARERAAAVPPPPPADKAPGAPASITHSAPPGDIL